MMSAFSRRLRVIRRGMGIADPIDFATLADIPAPAYAALEDGVAEPSAADLLAISRLAGVTVDFLITGQGLTLA